MYLTIRCNYELHAWQKLYMASDTIRLMLEYDQDVDESDLNIKIKRTSD